MIFRAWLKAATLVFLTPISAQADTATPAPVRDWRGPYVGVFLGTTFDSKSDAGRCENVNPYHRCRDQDDDNYIPHFFNQYSNATQSGIAGVQVGYNIQFDHPKGYKWLPNVLGLEGELGRLNYGETIGGLGGPNWGDSMDMPGAADYTTDLTKYRFIGARAGYAVGQNLFYLKGGLVYTDMTTTFCSAATNDCQRVASPWAPGEFVEFGGQTGTAKGPGHAFGAGFERALPWGGGNKWSVKAEYLKMNLPSISTAGTGTFHGVPPFSYPTGLAIYQTLRDFRTFKISLDYKFNGLLPVDLANPVQTEDITPSGTHDWRGPYVGVFLGASFDSKSDAGLCENIGWFWQCQDGSHWDVFIPQFFNQYSQSTQSGIAGGQIGYNIQFDHPKGYKWLPSVLGLEVETGRLNYSESVGGYGDETWNDNSDHITPTMPGAAAYTTELKKYNFVGARVGYAVGQSLFYVKGGLVYTDMQTTFCSAQTVDCMWVNPDPNNPDPATRYWNGGSIGKSEGAGHAFGAGFERALPWDGGNKWSVKAEYLKMNLPSISTAGMGTFHGVPPLSYPTGLAIHQTLNDFQTFKIGLDYKF